jgi:hypothetical protein
MALLEDAPSVRAVGDLEPGVVDLDSGIEVDLLDAPGDLQLRVASLGFPDRGPDVSPRVDLVAQIELDQVAGARAQMAGHAGEVVGRLRKVAQIRQRVDGADRAAEFALEFESRHVGHHHLAR